MHYLEAKRWLPQRAEWKFRVVPDCRSTDPSGFHLHGMLIRMDGRLLLCNFFQRATVYLIAAEALFHVQAFSDIVLGLTEINTPRNTINIVKIKR